MVSRSIKTILFSSLFPNEQEPSLGIFVENRLRHLIQHFPVDCRVIAPVPFFPFKGEIFGRYGRMAAIARQEERSGLKIDHPRFLAVPKVGMRLTPLTLAQAGIRAMERLRQQGFDADLIDAHYLYPDGVAAARMARHFGKPFVLTARGSDVTEIADYPFAWKQMRQAIEAAGRVITVSQSLKRALVTKGIDPATVTVLRNGVDLQRFSPTRRAETRAALGLRGPVLLYVGWLIPRKRLDLVLAATAAHTQVTTLIVGTGPDAARLKKQTQALNIADRVHFLGAKKPAELAPLYSAADVLLLPSDREGWANVLLEAMACGTPVVTRDVGAGADLVTSDAAGRIAAAGTADAVADAVGNILRDPPGREDTRRFAEGFGWEETSAGQWDIFRRLVDRHDRCA